MSEIDKNLLQKYKGCLVGAAVGDALGMQVEGLTRSEIKQLRGTQRVMDYGRAPPGHPNHKLLPGQYTDDTEQMVAHNAQLSSCPTHTGSGSIAGAIAIATAVYLSLKNTPAEEMLRKIIGMVAGVDKTLTNRIKEILHTNSAIEEFFPGEGVSNSVYETVPAALLCTTKYRSFEEAVITAANIGGDTDSVACMTGAIKGARHGINAIPRRWITGLERTEYIEALALQLFNMPERYMKSQNMLRN
ncbi:hypothetical protein B6U67_01355 [Methanosarcinales archaeon ex4484_138]|nr:MAG: hypothetical protein B6U67_01355 [Methanosarcinales archaeon ex4484_138]